MAERRGLVVPERLRQRVEELRQGDMKRIKGGATETPPGQTPAAA